MGEDKKQQGYIEKTVTFLVPTQVGDKWLNKDEYDFFETKGGEIVIVKEKIQ